MPNFKVLISRLVALFRKQRLEEELDEELRAHVELQTEENIRQGMSSEEARYAALRSFGGVEQAKESYRDRRGLPMVETVIQDFRFGLRMLAKSPGFTAVVVFSLALGIGANTAIFSLIDAVMLKMLPVREPEQLRLLSWAAQSQPGTIPGRGIIHSLSGGLSQDRSGRTTCTSFSYPVFEQFHARSDLFSNIFAFAETGRVNLNAHGQAQLAEAVLVSGDFFSGLGVGTVLGRTITEADDRLGATPVAVVSYGYWERRFGRQASAVGKAITIDNIPFTIIGVSQPEFFGLQPGRAIDVWLPLHTQPQVEPEPSWAQKGRSKFIMRDDWWVSIMARLKPGVSDQQARAALEVTFQQSIAPQQEATPSSAPIKKSPDHGSPTEPQDIPHLELASASRGLDDLRQEFSKPLFILMGVVGLVLLIACANVANLLLARATTRRKEIAVRLAIGAGRRRLVRQLLTESVILASLGGGFGLLLAYWATSLLITFMSSGRDPIALSVSPDLHVLAFTVAVSLVTGIVFGLAPASRTTRVDLTTALKDTSGGVFSGIQHGRLRLGLGKALVVSQVAMSLLLLAGAGLFVRTLQNLESVDVGFSRRSILLFGVDPTQDGYKGQRLATLYQELQQRVAALPGVRSVSASVFTLIGGGVGIDGISVSRNLAAGGSGGRDMQDCNVHTNEVGPGFFETMGIPLLLGRTIGPEDTSVAPKVAVINQTLAKQCFGSSNPVGRHFGYNSSDFEVVGVVGNAKSEDLRKEVPPTVYIPYTQNLERLGLIHFEVRTAGDPIAMIPSVRRSVQDVDRNLPLFDLKTQVEQIDQTIFQERLFAKLSSFFGLLALTLVCVGLYGTLTYAVTQRVNEIGIRVALGAAPGTILGMVIRDGLAQVAIGIAIGVPAALAACRLIASMLFGVKATDPLTIAGASSVLIAVAALAGYLPARRATRVDPMAVLRYE